MFGKATVIQQGCGISSVLHDSETWRHNRNNVPQGACPQGEMSARITGGFGQCFGRWSVLARLVECSCSPVSTQRHVYLLRLREPDSTRQKWELNAFTLPPRPAHRGGLGNRLDSSLIPFLICTLVSLGEAGGLIAAGLFSTDQTLPPFSEMTERSPGI